MSFSFFTPALFIFFWSTGWIVAKYIVPFADPFAFLILRYAGAGLIFMLIALIYKAKWPKGVAIIHAMVSGILLQAFYLGGVWWAISHGLPAGISALIAALQPLITTILATKLVHEKVKPIHGIGMLVGFIGVLGIIYPKLSGHSSLSQDELFMPILVNIGATISVTLGTFYQKRFVSSGDLRTITALQYLGCLIVTIPPVLLFGSMHIEWRFETFIAFVWSAFALSIGAAWLMLFMIRKGEVTKIAALIYLVPPTTAIMAFFMFDETLTMMQIACMGLVAFGVSLATRP